MIKDDKVSLGVVLFVNGTHSEYVDALRVAGYTVEIAPSALEALQRGHSLRPDALIVPLLMPDMGGADLAHRIGTAVTRAHTLAVVILVPADGNPPSAGATVKAGATFCTLPCLPTELVAVVGKQLAARRVMHAPQAPPS